MDSTARVLGLALAELGSIPNTQICFLYGLLEPCQEWSFNTGEASSTAKCDTKTQWTHYLWLILHRFRLLKKIIIVHFLIEAVTYRDFHRWVSGIQFSSIKHTSSPPPVFLISTHSHFQVGVVIVWILRFQFYWFCNSYIAGLHFNLRSSVWKWHFKPTRKSYSDGRM